MGKKHLKRLNTPNTWNILRKEGSYVTRSYPGRNNKKLSVPLSVFFKDIVGLAHTTKEVRQLLHKEEVLVDGKRVEDVKNPVEFMDVVTLPSIKSSFRLTLDNHGRLTHVAVKDAEKGVKLSRIIGKTSIKGNKIQINLSDARNIIVDKNDYQVGDSLLIEVPTQKIQQHFKLEKGVPVILMGGKHAGQKGVVEEIDGNKIRYKGERKSSLTLKKYAFAVGKDKPAIEL